MSEKFWVRKILGSNKIAGPKIFGMKKKNILVQKNYDPKKLGQKGLVKIRPVTAEILMIVSISYL